MFLRCNIYILKYRHIYRLLRCYTVQSRCCSKRLPLLRFDHPGTAALRHCDEFSKIKIKNIFTVRIMFDLLVTQIGRNARYTCFPDRLSLTNIRKSYILRERHGAAVLLVRNAVVASVSSALRPIITSKSTGASHFRGKL